MAHSKLAWILLGVALAPAAVARAALPADTLLANGDFATGALLAGWDLGNAIATWSPLDVAEEGSSGSARVGNDAPGPGDSREISQCVPTRPGPHALGAWYWIPSGQAPATGDAGVRWFFHAGGDCEDFPLDAGQVSTENIVVVPDVWGELSTDVAAPAGTGSARLYLVNRRESGAGTFVVQFDDAYLVPAPPALASGLAAALALAALSAARPLRERRSARRYAELALPAR